MPGAVSNPEDNISEPGRQRFSITMLPAYLKKQTLNEQFHKGLRAAAINSSKTECLVL